jgi:adenosylcobyric acid synthase
MPARVLMLQGTSSDAGKSLLAAGLCRLLTRRGLRVRPFKPQNMSNNAAVTPDGGEIGRAQALQARACGVAASRHMNPVLLKPESDTGAQVIVQGKRFMTCSARDYHALKPTLLPLVLDSFMALCDEADIVIAEGAGSPAEKNLRDGDIANMGFALAAGCPVILVSDIERGGALAAIVGTMRLLDQPERSLVRGYLVNKFRGDPRLFDDALPILRDETGLDCLGVVPWFPQARQLPQEDILGLAGTGAKDGPLRVAVPRLPRIANFDDLDPLAHEPDVEIRLLEPGDALPGDTDLVLLPGSKSTIADLAALRAAGWDVDIRAHVRRGGWVIGLCGGYQMLGREIADPRGIEGQPRTARGLGLLDVATELLPDKTVRPASATELATGLAVHGYEIHLGRTGGADACRPMLRLESGEPDGALAPRGRVMGCYLHGLFAADDFRHAFLARIRSREPSGLIYARTVGDTLEALAEHLGACLDLDAVLAAARVPLSRSAGLP